MARTSRRFEEKKEITNNRTQYRAGIYTRLSNERTESWRDKSSSVETQTLTCQEYALKENIQVVEVYTDYEYSGTNFNRPEFQNMMQAIRERKINCIIIKDLSRLGREYLEMGRLIDKVFPFLGVRFISVNDNLDTIKEMDSKKSFEVTIKNIINDMYAKDISVKIKTTKMNRAKNGFFIGSVPPYGYKVIKEEGGQRLEVDKNVRFIVEEIFALTLEGKSQLEVAKHINEKRYATPMTYYRTGRVFRKDGDSQWHVGSLAKMLTNQSYAGDMVQGIKSQFLAQGKKQAIANKENHIVVENTHEAIISKDDFFMIQEERQKRKAESVFSAKPHDFKRDPENRFKGLIFSAKTGEELFRRTRINGKSDKKVLKYLYRNERFRGDIHNQDTLFVMEEDLDKRIAQDVAEALKSMTKRTRFTNRVKDRYTRTIEFYKDKLTNLDNVIKKEEYNSQKSYESYSLGEIDRDTYLLERDVSLGRLATIEKEKIAIENNIAEIKKDRRSALSWIEAIFSAEGLDKLPTELIEALVEKIIVKETHDFEVIYKFNMEGLREESYE
ncbi:recombinase family protein [Helcococcus ovis]|uniref:recombinase family protein n=1 Tax=Helcococcus ovis TaxID=72026 RepID=UPI0038BC3B80